MKDFLLEIGVEEIPAGYIPKACSDLKAAFDKLLADDSYKDIRIETFATPRRLAILIKDVAEAQQDRETLRTGPPLKAAYDEQGNPTKAALGFAKGQGVSVDDLTVEKTPKGEYLAVIKKEVGKSTPTYLAANLPEIIKSIPFPKSMRWADRSLRFARPIHWIVALFGEEIVQFELDGIKSSNMSRGHRFLPQVGKSELKPFPISTVTYPNHPFGEREESYYVHDLRKNNVFPDPYLRKEKIRTQLVKEVQVADPNWSYKEDEDLLEEVTYLVECPKVILGTFDERFLALPDEVLITAMREHQKYFSVIDEEGKLVNRFLLVSNMDIEDTTLIRTGNERVLRARLTDAEFFYQSDTKRDFAALTDKLQEIVFQEKLGTVRDKVERIRKICVWLTPKLEYDFQVAKDVYRAAQLCKNDLLTEMVNEFPKLQGIMGREYAKKSGENQAVAQAVYEHYLPKPKGDEYPRSSAGIVLSIADKIDTICGCFGVGLIPTGSADPYALRRQTLGIIAILLAHKKHLNLEQMVETALNTLGDIIKEPEETKSAVLDFFKKRLHNIFISMKREYRYDLVEAILAHHYKDPLDAQMRIEALSKMRKEDYFEPLITSFKRVSRIIPDEAWDYQFSPDKLVDPAEISLWEAFNQIREKADAQLEAKEYNNTMEIVAGLRGDVDRFFDEVLVMAKEEEVRKNRLALLVQLALFFRKIADFSRIVVESNKNS